jgi:hypothetical protein
MPEWNSHYFDIVHYDVCQDINVSTDLCPMSGITRRRMLTDERGSSLHEIGIDCDVDDDPGLDKVFVLPSGGDGLHVDSKMRAIVVRQENVPERQFVRPAHSQYSAGIIYDEDGTELDIRRFYKFHVEFSEYVRKAEA